MGVGLGISMGFAVVVIIMTLWNIRATIQRRRENATQMAQFESLQSMLDGYELRDKSSSATGDDAPSVRQPLSPIVDSISPKTVTSVRVQTWDRLSNLDSSLAGTEQTKRHLLPAERKRSSV